MSRFTRFLEHTADFVEEIEDVDAVGSFNSSPNITRFFNVPGIMFPVSGSKTVKYAAIKAESTHIYFCEASSLIDEYGAATVEADSYHIYFDGRDYEITHISYWDQYDVDMVAVEVRLLKKE